MALGSSALRHLVALGLFSSFSFSAANRFLSAAAAILLASLRSRALPTPFSRTSARASKLGRRSGASAHDASISPRHPSHGSGMNPSSFVDDPSPPG